MTKALGATTLLRSIVLGVGMCDSPLKAGRQRRAPSQLSVSASHVGFRPSPLAT